MRSGREEEKCENLRLVNSTFLSLQLQCIWTKFTIKKVNTIVTFLLIRREGTPSPYGPGPSAFYIYVLVRTTMY